MDNWAILLFLQRTGNRLNIDSQLRKRPNGLQMCQAHRFITLLVLVWIVVELVSRLEVLRPE